MDFLLPFWRQLGRKWCQIRCKSHHFLIKRHGNSVTWTCPKSMSCSGYKLNWRFMGKTRDMDFDRNSMSCPVTNWLQFSPNWHKIPCLFHVISCHKSTAVWSKCDMDFHKNSMTFYVTNWWQLGPNWHQILWQVHVIYLGFIWFPCPNMTWIW